MNASGDTHEVIECYNKTATQYAAKFSDELNEKNFERIYLKGFADRQGIGNFPLLDAGCGIGHISKYLADYGFRIVGIDISPNMISKAEQLYPGITF
jgi:2-polyprenyl-3-methyl-5-hydroxy-6-metoxy-1,4-benzoquinol methylase